MGRYAKGEFFTNSHLWLINYESFMIRKTYWALTVQREPRAGSYSNPHFADTSRKPQLIKPDVTIAIKTLTTHDIFQMRHNYESLKNWSRQGMSNLEALIFEFLKLFRMKVTWLESMMPIGCRSIAFNFNQCQQLILVSSLHLYLAFWVTRGRIGQVVFRSMRGCQLL